MASINETLEKCARSDQRAEIGCSIPTWKIAFRSTSLSLFSFCAEVDFGESSTSVNVSSIYDIHIIGSFRSLWQLVNNNIVPDERGEEYFLLLLMVAPDICRVDKQLVEVDDFTDDGGERSKSVSALSSPSVASSDKQKLVSFK